MDIMHTDLSIMRAEYNQKKSVYSLLCFLDFYYVKCTRKVNQKGPQEKYL